MSSTKTHNVLITGVTSTLGRQLARLLYYDKRIGFILGVAIDDRPFYFDDFSSSRFHYMRVDLTKPRQVNNLFYSDIFKDMNIDTVIHMAFLNKPSDVGEKSHELNVVGTKMLIDKCLETRQVTKFIFKSSHLVYKIRPHNPVMLDEEADLNFDKDAPQWIRDRVDADMICRAKMDNPHMNVVVLRFSNIVGRNIHSLMNAYLSSKVAMTVMGFDPMVNLIHPRDAIYAIQLAIHKNIKGVYNIVGRDTAPLHVFLDLNKTRRKALPEPLHKLVNSWQKKLGVTDFDFEAGRDLLKFAVLLDPAKAERVLGYKPRHHVEFG